ncbi:amidohydrolase/deacetylase family metallohydrolase [Microvirga sp. W0021]|uniref:Amidohydrolase/deacetylase family metallohydrolase n=1 Tax=Hohaiivirga grylli TaxID=3133970 RepID=A0ABV0BGS4_9HYPH
MYDLLIRNARLADDTTADVAVKNGKIAALGQLGEGAAAKTVDLKQKYYLSAGWIDNHVHAYPSSPIYYDEPDLIGIAGGVTTIVDAGSTGATDIADFKRIAANCKTNVKALLNVSRIGMIVQHELANMDDINAQLDAETIAQHRDFIVGIKARMSGSVVGSNGIEPLRLAKDIQSANGDLPLMVHVGNPPPTLEEIVDLMGKNDILTHCFNGKPNRILDGDGRLRDAVKQAVNRGMLLDVGHGSASFSFEVARQAINEGILPDTISTDIYYKNRMNGPVISLALVMSKFLYLGMTLPQVIERVTSRAADMFGFDGKGRLEVGADADLTLFDIDETALEAHDCEGGVEMCSPNLIPLAAVVAGEVFVTEHGSGKI